MYLVSAFVLCDCAGSHYYLTVGAAVLDWQRTLCRVFSPTGILVKGRP